MRLERQDGSSTILELHMPHQVTEENVNLFPDLCPMKTFADREFAKWVTSSENSPDMERNCPCNNVYRAYRNWPDRSQAVRVMSIVTRNKPLTVAGVVTLLVAYLTTASQAIETIVCVIENIMKIYAYLSPSTTPEQ